MPRLRLAALLLMLAVAGCEATARVGAPERGSVGRVQRVVDGDTIHVRVDGRRETVRYIGVDTPESVKPGAPVECFAKRAGAFNERLVEGERVRLVLDAEHRDRYGRLLAYVYRVRDGVFVNAALVRRGYAQPLSIPPNVAHAREFRRLASRARRDGRGLWSACRSS
jgi:micrococcal nuclease